MKIFPVNLTATVPLSLGFYFIPVGFKSGNTAGAKYGQAAVLSGFGQAEEDDPQHSLNSRGQG